MKKWIFSSLVLLILVSCSHKVYQSILWQTNKIQIDGAENDWNIPLKYYDKNLKLNYEFTNDRNNLYFAARTVDESTIQQIASGGLKLQLDTLAESNNYPYSLTYPVMQGPPNMQGNMQDNTASNQKGNKPEMREITDLQGFNQQPGMTEPFNQEGPQIATKEINLSGFSSIQSEQNTVPFSKAKGIIASYYKNDEGILFYEMVIPFKTFYKTSITASDTLNAFSCCISLNGAMSGERPSPPDGENNNSMGNPPGGGMGGPPPGGMQGPPPGGMQGGPMQNNNDMTNSGTANCKIKRSFCLSYQ